MSGTLQETSSSTTSEQRGIPLPAKVTVSLRAGFVLALANIVCVVILVWGYMQVKAAPKEISVTGSAKKLIVSDLIIWSGRISVNHADLLEGYDALKIAADKTVEYLKAQGVPAGEIRLSSIQTRRNFTRDEKGNHTDKVSSYDLSMGVEVTSMDVAGISEVARKATELIKEGVMLESDPPQYLYTKLADLKIEMLAEATKDATSRAQQIAGNSGASLGSIQSARMGVMQINPANTSGVSDSGNNDTTSLEKEITAVVSARFSLR